MPNLISSLALSAVVMAAGFVWVSTASAQEEEAGPQKRENVTYHSIVFVDYKPGKTGEAEEIIQEYFAPAAEASGLTPPYSIHFQSGSWDHAHHWSMEDFDDLHWTRTRQDADWWAALAEIAGSDAEAEAVMDRFNSLIAREKVVLGHHHESDNRDQ